jgi:hypothetical protein
MARWEHDEESATERRKRKRDLSPQDEAFAGAKAEEKSSACSVRKWQARKRPHEGRRYRGKLAGKDVGIPRNAYGVMAIARRGLPEPLTIFRGAAMTTAPVGGN